MAPILYPRGTVKKIVKAHANRPLSKNVDILVRITLTRPLDSFKTDTSTRYTSTMRCSCKSTYIHYHTSHAIRDNNKTTYECIGTCGSDKLTLRRLINEASIKSKQSGERGVSARSIKKVSETTLRKHKG
jgi:hypothetical protein